MSSPTLSDLLQHVNLAIHMLDVEIQEGLYYDVSACFSDWKSVALASGVNIDDYDHDYRKEKEKKIAFMKDWKLKLANKATYKQLIMTLLDRGAVDDARKILVLFKNKVRKDHSSEPTRGELGGPRDSHAHQPVLTAQEAVTTCKAGDNANDSQEIEGDDAAAIVNVEDVLMVLTDGGFSAADGESLGTYLKVPQGKLKTIKSSRNGQVEDMLRDILDYWIKNSSASWKELANAVKQCNYGNLASKLLRRVTGAAESTTGLRQRPQSKRQQQSLADDNGVAKTETAKGVDRNIQADSGHKSNEGIQLWGWIANPYFGLLLFFLLLAIVLLLFFWK